jgi:hypothetical protein
VPPAAAHIGRANRRPLFVGVDFDVSEEVVRFGVEEDGIRVHAVSAKHLFELRPDRPVPPLVLVFRARR